MHPILFGSECRERFLKPLTPTGLHLHRFNGFRGECVLDSDPALQRQICEAETEREGVHHNHPG